MIKLQRIVLDILKPHHPGALEFASAMAERMPGCRVMLRVDEMDERTETLQVVIEGELISFDSITDAIADLGASLHSIDEVDVLNTGSADSDD
jgi:hypothetical protein